VRGQRDPAAFRQSWCAADPRCTPGLARGQRGGVGAAPSAAESGFARRSAPRTADYAEALPFSRPPQRRSAAAADGSRHTDVHPSSDGLTVNNKQRDGRFDAEPVQDPPLVLIAAFSLGAVTLMPAAWPKPDRRPRRRWRALRRAGGACRDARAGLGRDAVRRPGPGPHHGPGHGGPAAGPARAPEPARLHGGIRGNGAALVRRRSAARRGSARERGQHGPPDEGGHAAGTAAVVVTPTRIDTVYRRRDRAAGHAVRGGRARRESQAARCGRAAAGLRAGVDLRVQARLHPRDPAGRLVPRGLRAGGRPDGTARSKKILAAEIVTRGSVSRPSGSTAARGRGYYDDEARPLRNGFSRYPVDFRRITSNYNPNRYHPILGVAVRTRARTSVRRRARRSCPRPPAR
jgi:hypothetical protein